MIYGERVRLRALTRDDARKLVEWRNDPEVKALLGDWSWPVSLEQEEEWLVTLPGDKSSKRLAIERLDTSEYIGNVGLYQIDWKNRRAEFAILIGEKSAWGQGFGLDATHTLLRFAFDELNLHRVYLHVLAHHERARRMYEKAGFKAEGRLQQDTFRAGAYHDSLVMAILAPEYRARRS